MQAFYGAGDWLHMPLRWLRCHVEMLPRLEAERALFGVTVAQAADSWLKLEDRQPMIREWQRTAQPPAETRRKPTKEEFMASMAAMGFQVVE